MKWFTCAVHFVHRKVKFDHLDKAYCILKFNKVDIKETDDDANEKTVIRRVDLIVSPPDQYPFALVSWTGSKVI